MPRDIDRCLRTGEAELLPISLTSPGIRARRMVSRCPIIWRVAIDGSSSGSWTLCLRDYEQDWLNYQSEIAARHTSLKKNQTDSVNSTAYVPFRDIIAFTAVMNQTIKPYLAAGGSSAGDGHEDARSVVQVASTANRAVGPQLFRSGALFPAMVR